MGRPKKSPTLDEQIKAAEDKVYKYAKPYQEATEELKRLLDIRCFLTGFLVKKISRPEQLQ